MKRLRSARAWAGRLLQSGLALSLVMACEEAPEASVVTRTDSAGVEIVHSAAPVPSGRPFGLGRVLLDLASPSDAAGREFFRVSDFVRGSGVYVVSEPHRVRAFSDGGALLWDFGREGDGPREFRRVTDVELRSDSIVVYDYGRRRVTILTREGAWARAFQLNVDFPGTELSPLGGDALVLEASFPSVLVDDVGLGLVRVPTPVLRVSWSGEVVDTVAVALGDASVRIRGTNGIIDQRPIFGHTSHVAVRDGRIVLGDGVFLGFQELDAEGRIVRVVRGDQPLELTEELLAAEWRVREGLLGPAHARELRETSPLPASRPAYSRLLVGADGSVWLKEHRGEFAGFAGPGPQVWQVFDERGAWLGSVDVPTSFRPIEVHEGRVLGIYRDQLDVEHPQVRAIESWNGASDGRFGAARGGRP